MTAPTSTRGAAVADHHEPGDLADDLVEPATELARRWLAEAPASRAERAATERLRRLTSDAGSLAFAMAFSDRVLRPESATVAARQLRRVAGPRTPRPRFLGWADRALLRAGARLAPALPPVVMPLARARRRALVGDLVADARDPRLGAHLARLRAQGFGVNVNLLGEAVLGHAEAARRRRAVTELMARPDVDCISVKVTAVCAQLNVWSFAETLARAKDALRELLLAAAATTPTVFVTLDMEEYRDLALTFDAFTGLLDEPELRGLEAGIVLQAYLPDSLGALQRLAEWAATRRRGGGAGARVRIVKGANLAMERVDAALRDWVPAPYASKAETDANHKAMLDFALRPEHAAALRVGVGGHNLFDLAWAHLLAEARGVGGSVTFEMLQGMAPAAARAVRRDTGRVLLYTPVVRLADFDHALAYLFRRLEENAGGENFLAARAGPADGVAFRRERARFAAAVAARHEVRSEPSWRSRAARGRHSGTSGAFANEPDSDPTDPRARAALAGAPARVRLPELPSELDDDGVDDAVVAADAGAACWGRVSSAERAALLERCAEELSARRAELVGLMALEAHKTLTEADTEVSEAVDFARFYAARARELDALDGVEARPLGVVVVAGPWNFPLAIPIGGALAALAAGNAAILKPAPQTPAVALAAVEACRAAGVTADVLRYVRCPDGPVGSRLIAHPGVAARVLTGSYETAELFARSAPGTPLMAETSGKNAMVVMPEADLDLAAADLAHSAFGHAGQKCSAASLGILIGDVATSSRFRTQLLDAVRSLALGPAAAPSTIMGPLVEAPSDRLQRALTTLEAHQRWLLEPRLVDRATRLWSPGILEGVRPGDWFARTECFGPVLGLMAVRDLDEALAVQNAVPYGLTGGIWSLDPDDCDRWLEGVEVGNAYVNRVTTGAVAGRQPFGGWKRSVAGPGAKTGGPNYVLQLCQVRDRDGVPPVHGGEPSHVARAVLDELGAGLTAPERAALDVAARSDAFWWTHEFGTTRDTADLFCESNVLRYRTMPDLTVRVAPGASRRAVARVLLAAVACAPAAHAHPYVGLSVHPDVDAEANGWRAWLSGLDRLEAVGPLVVERSEALVARLAGRPQARLRLVGAEAALGSLEPAVHVDDRPPVLSGRVELLRALREQTVSRTLHRFGNVVEQGRAPARIR